jgi:S1-C subfamily serine protease
VVRTAQSRSSADGAGLQQEDVITSFGRKPVTSADQLATGVQNDNPGKGVKIAPYRSQTQMTATATLARAVSPWPRDGPEPDH